MEVLIMLAFVSFLTKGPEGLGHGVTWSRAFSKWRDGDELGRKAIRPQDGVYYQPY